MIYIRSGIYSSCANALKGNPRPHGDTQHMQTYKYFAPRPECRIQLILAGIFHDLDRDNEMK